jgi:hypothetical protein
MKKIKLEPDIHLTVVNRELTVEEEAQIIAFIEKDKVELKKKINPK